MSGIDLERAIDWLRIVNDLPFLRVIQLEYCNLPSRVPWPLSYKNSTTTLSYLSLAGNDLNDLSIFQWLFNLSGMDTHLAHVDLSHNQLEGPFPSAFGKMHNLSYLNLSGNQLEGRLPEALGNMHNLSYLDLSGNQLEDPLPEALGNMHALSHLDLSNNKLQGSIPDTISNLQSLQYFDLSSNKLSQFPKIFGNLCSLQVLHLEEANITGCANKSLLDLFLSDNQIWGPIPDTIGTFSSLQKLFLENNRLNGTISSRLGQLSKLEILSLSSNSLHGTLCSSHFSNLSRLSALDLSNNPALVLDIEDDWIPPFQLDYILLRSCRLGPIFPHWLVSQSNYWVLDISAAGISDSIPEFFTLPSMLTYLNMSHNMMYGTFPYFDVWNTSMLTLSFIDLSNNKLEGKIPIEISALQGLVSLNLSRNSLIGSITPEIGRLTALEVLDLSNNHLSGEIPASITALSSLSNLDLSNNHFFGEIPKGTQLQGFNASVYAGNPQLCGAPLSNCSWDQPHHNSTRGDNTTPHDDTDDDKMFIVGLYVSVVLGFIIGFWGVCGTLVLKRSWRRAFFQFFDDMKDRLYVMVSSTG